MHTFHLVGHYNNKTYSVKPDVPNMYNVKINAHSYYQMRYAAQYMFEHATVPDNSKFNHHFDYIEVRSESGVVFANIGPYGTYRYL